MTTPVDAPPAPRFGIWAQVYGSFASMQHPQDPVDATWRRMRDQVIEAEALGYDSTLLAEHLINPFGGDFDQQETWTASAALAALTSRIEIIAAVKPYLFEPAVLAKMALQIEEISQGRMALNLVNAWWKPEFDAAGIDFRDHDSRYEYGREWLLAVRSLLTGQPTTVTGERVRINDMRLRPASPVRERPTIYLGGASEPARALAADAADVFFINGQPKESVAEIVRDVARRPRHGTPIRFGLAAFVITRETADEAAEALRYAWELAALDEPALNEMLKGADPKAEMFQTMAKYPAIGTNGGTAAGLVGDYDTVAQRIAEFNDLGIETFMLQFQPFEAEMRRFAAEVIPRVRNLTGRR